MLKTLRWFKHLHDLDPARLPSLTYVHCLPPTLCFSNPDLLVSPGPPCYCTTSCLWSAPRLCALPGGAHPLQLAASPSELPYHPLARLHTIPHFSVIPCNSPCYHTFHNVLWSVTIPMSPTKITEFSQEWELSPIDFCIPAPNSSWLLVGAQWTFDHNLTKFWWNFLTLVSKCFQFLKKISKNTNK